MKPRFTPKPRKRDLALWAKANDPNQTLAPEDYQHTRKKSVKREEPIHIEAVVALKKLILPHVMLHHSPNGGRRDPREAAKLKAMGVRAGWLDITLMWSTQLDFFLAFIEMKAPGETLSPNQEDFTQWLDANNIPWGVAYSAEDAINLAKQFGVPMRSFSIAVP